MSWLRVKIACYRCKAAQGRFPGQLSQLTPTYLPTLPDDPFGGASDIPLHYRPLREGTGFVLYSIGLNMRNENGISASPRAPGDADDIAAGNLFSHSR